MSRDNDLDQVEEISMYRRVGFVLGPLFFVILLILPELAGMTPTAQRMAAVTIWMAIWWITEAIPIPATALLPLVLFPLLGIASAKTAATPYANHLIFLFLGGFFIALGVQKWQLHKRIALKTISVLGFSPPRLVLGFMIATAFLSMWISNTATAVIMLPIGLAVVKHFQSDDSDGRDKKIGNFGSALMFGIAYAASIGGIGTLIGTPPNIILAGMLEEMHGQSISFTRWMMVGLPLVIVFLPIAWFYLTRIACPVWGSGGLSGSSVIREELSKIGKMSVQERRVAMVFFLTALAWVLSDAKNFGSFTIPGLKSLFPGITDSTIAMSGALALFILPAKGISGKRLLDWSSAKDIPWGILLLFGGGLALAEGFKLTQLDLWIGGRLDLFQYCPILLIIIVLVALVIFLTEVTSNTATTAMILPVCGALAVTIGQDPLLLMVPAAMAASCAFMLPVGTPPNALIFASGQVTIPQMARIGVWLNFMGIVIITLITYAVAIPLLGL
ncbi:anion transporter [candidate division LCP-89 bacterium B3_LCP]|uniref:Anion transporter n=1 Tax=candidate division LCP-89 bacterium B3_LCP TaxID=2012998 RepID=A0A532UYN7_UNCL8|nr:MAG: anion transporter [candidate division LCP-89 bacterium B3_LCP]